MRTKIINEQLTDLLYNFIEMEDRIAANDRYADLNSAASKTLRWPISGGDVFASYGCVATNRTPNVPGPQ